MKIREPYKRHVIEAMSFELRGNLGFVSDLFIERHDATGVAVTHFHVPQVFDTNESALLETMRAGGHKVDVGYAIP